VLGEYRSQRQALSRFYVGGHGAVGRGCRCDPQGAAPALPNVKIEVEQIRDVLVNEVLKRDVTEGERAVEARKRIAKASGRALRAKKQTRVAGVAQDEQEAV